MEWARQNWVLRRPAPAAEAELPKGSSPGAVQAQAGVAEPRVGPAETNFLGLAGQFCRIFRVFSREEGPIS